MKKSNTESKQGGFDCSSTVQAESSKTAAELRGAPPKHANPQFMPCFFPTLSFTRRSVSPSTSATPPQQPLSDLRTSSARLAGEAHHRTRPFVEEPKNKRRGLSVLILLQRLGKASWCTDSSSPINASHTVRG